MLRKLRRPGKYARAEAAACLLVVMSIQAAGCDPYTRLVGNYLAGSVNPENFPQDYLGTGGVGSMASMGLFIPIPAFAHGSALGGGYYLFHLSAAQMAAADPLDATALAPAIGYVFDPPSATQAIPGAGQSRCAAPANYVYDAQRDPYRMDQQGNVFTDLPDDTAVYVPIVAQSTVRSAGEPCQDIKSQAELLDGRQDVTVKFTPADPSLPMSAPTGLPDSPPRFLAWPVIDPGARVLALTDDPNDPPPGGDSLQQWGFYNQYLLAYLDGGYIPTTPNAMTMGPEFVAQDLYFPTSAVGMDAMGNPIVVPGRVGAGNDVLQFTRSDAGYSPLCHVFSYTPKLDANALPIVVHDAAGIDTAAATDTGTILYCLQLQ